MSSIMRRAVSVLLGAQAVLWVALSPAQAERAPAPITYAGQGGAQTFASLDNNLAGGTDASYGYGVARRTAAAPIDLRRSTASSAPAVAPAPSQQAASAAEQGRPAWLEQERVGAPYQVNGRWYVPAAEPGYEMVGTASWYGPTFHGQATASGEPFDQEALTAAHPTLPIPSLVQVTNLENGREVILRVNDRGPFVGDRVLDVSHKAAEVLGFDQQGHARVNVRYLGPAPRHVTDGVMAQGARPPATLSAVQPVSASVATDGPRSLLPPTQPVADDNAPSEFAPIQPSEANVTPVAYQVAAASGYFVQVGAFSDAANAQRVGAAVRSAGSVQVDTRQTAQGQLYRVRIGPFADREGALSAQRTLADLGYAQTILAAR